MPEPGFMLNPPQAYPSWDRFEEDLEALAGLGFSGVELALGDPAQLDAGRLAEALARRRLDLSSIATGASYFEEGLCLTSPDPANRAAAVARLRAHVDLAARFPARRSASAGRPVIVVGQLQGFKDDEPDREVANDRTVACLKEVADYAGSKEVLVVLEPVNRFEVGHNHTAAEVLELVERIGSPALTLMLDTFHINIEECSLDGPVQLAGRRLGHMHVFDNHRGLLGTGHLDLARILRATLEAGYQRYWVCGDFSANNLAVRAGAAIDFLRRAGLMM